MNAVAYKYIDWIRLVKYFSNKGTYQLYPYHLTLIIFGGGGPAAGGGGAIRRKNYFIQKCII